MLHKLKIENPYFDDVYYGRKKFEVRKNDRGFKVGDRLQLIEIVSAKIPRYILVDVIYILQGGQFGIDENFVVMGIQMIKNG